MTAKERVGVVGLGYVGLSVAVGMARKFPVIGFDIDQYKIDQLRRHKDSTNQFSAQTLRKASIQFVTDTDKLRTCSHIIIAVPTPVTAQYQPDLSFIENASKQVAGILTKGTFVIYESTVYPGATEDVCIPLLEKYSGLQAGKEFYVGYSPERINPGDNVHTFTTNPKIVAGQNKTALNGIYKLYRNVLEGYIFQASSIKIAEAAKVVENTQRDINIAFMNELSLMFDRLNIDTYEVLEAASTKWNFLSFTPGLVGGHCIGIDPYYLIYQAEKAGYSPKFLYAAREINESMPEFIVQRLLQWVISEKIPLDTLSVTVLGITFKENVSDVRNSKALEIVNKLRELKIKTQISDPHYTEHGKIPTTPLEKVKPSDIVILAVPHHVFKGNGFSYLQKLFKNKPGLLVDLKGVVPKDVLPKNIRVWRL
ncbi:nucleotide sugar dehydrogenase [Virgibacillus sp. 179-BFC.A HS]|uniref:Nucleotide sugar dehydrogenase n=1 Tax=Tigheibacillus jepli TaxID=3035914 RepID=A0ABU5CFC6_9BACI|nr:nucleotide sugar dehydrogenase [Virgibacillus sp. 179-BFC.A HS]MDY0405036.1 nucleotide sugar dehydrogenase [Virgibacillus sp. 179-BFC.A HS]